MIAPRRIGALLLAALACAGCGSARGSEGPSRALAAVLRELAAGRVLAVCDGLTARAAGQLAAEFGGSDCAMSVEAAVGFMRATPGERGAVARAAVLAPRDLPLSPAPPYAGARTARVRVGFEDPALGRRQFIDVGLRLAGGRWLVDSALDGLFTVLY